MDSVRTPDARFAGLADWPYAPQYLDVPDGEGGSLRMHYVDAGPRDGEIIWCQHGQPTWGYLYRHMIPVLVPVMPDNPAIPDKRKAWQVLGQFQRPFLPAFGDSDPVTAGGHKRFQEDVPGAKGQRQVTIKGAGHFLQESHGPELAQVIATFIVANPLEANQP